MAGYGHLTYPYDNNNHGMRLYYIVRIGHDKAKINLVPILRCIIRF